MKKPTIAVSACLLGQPVRYNGEHSGFHWIINTLGRFANLVPFCPEMEMGLGTPRDEIQLYYKGSDRKKLYLRSKKTGEDLTDQAYQAYHKILERLREQKVDGVIFMKNSPTCGLNRAKVVSEDGSGPVIHKNGLFSTFLLDHYKDLPAIDSGPLHGIDFRERFIKKVFAHFRLSEIECSTAGLQKFHQQYKYIIMEHSHQAVSQLGKIAANNEKKEFEDIYNDYKSLFFTTLSKEAKNSTRTNVFFHLLGYLKKHLKAEEKKEIIDVFSEYRKGIHNYSVPLNLLKIYVRNHGIDYLRNQYYFSPYPSELRIQKEIA